MRTLGFLVLCLASSAAAQNTVEGYWQDTERRILFSRDAPPGYVYGRWTALDQGQTYPSAKHIRKSVSGYEVLDLLYDDEEVIKVGSSGDQSIEFIRTNTWSGCAAPAPMCRYPKSPERTTMLGNRSSGLPASRSVSPRSSP